MKAKHWPRFNLASKAAGQVERLLDQAGPDGIRTNDIAEILQRNPGNVREILTLLHTAGRAAPTHRRGSAWNRWCRPQFAAALRKELDEQKKERVRLKGRPANTLDFESEVCKRTVISWEMPKRVPAISVFDYAAKEAA